MMVSNHPHRSFERERMNTIWRLLGSARGLWQWRFDRCYYWNLPKSFLSRVRVPVMKLGLRRSRWGRLCRFWESPQY